MTITHDIVARAGAVALALAILAHSNLLGSPNLVLGSPDLADDQTCASGTIRATGQDAGYANFQRFQRDWYQPDELGGDYRYFEDHRGGLNATLEYLGCFGQSYVWLNWQYDRFKGIAVRAPWGGATDRGLRINDDAATFHILYPTAHPPVEPSPGYYYYSDGVPKYWPASFDVWDDGPLRVVLRNGRVYIIEVDWELFSGDADTTSPTKVIVGPFTRTTQSGLWYPPKGATDVYMSHRALQFGATKAGAAGALTSVTPAQSVTVNMVGSSTAWTATSSQPWLQITNGSGIGPGRFSLSIVNPNNVLGASTDVNATVTVTVPAAQISLSVLVRLVVRVAPTTSEPSFGSFDSPAHNAANLSGAIPVTGWSLDDIGVDNVQLWRNCVVGIDPPAACTSPAPGQPPNFVFIANATFVSGARPDVEYLFAGTPRAYRAGWGYLMSTNALPHLVANTPTGGQGAFTLTAYSVDLEGHFALLGTRSIDLNNDGATIPFGTLDTPEQGGLVTTTPFASFGWAMTQNPKCILTTTSASYRVYIDGISRPLTAGNFTSNLTRPDIAGAYPGRCNTNDALAAYSVDVNALGLSNGLHTTGWDVFDNQGNAAGIGSRFFNILIGSSITPDAASPALRSGVSDDDRPIALGNTNGLAWLAPDRGPVKIQIGGDEAPFQISEPTSAGEHRVQFPSGGRLGIDLGTPVTAGFEIVGNELRALPSGSTLLADEGFFGWQPAVPFLGPFHLVFVRDNLRIDVKARIIDPSADVPVEMHIDLPGPDSSVGGSFIVAGWAINPLASSGSGVDTLHVWAYRRDGVAAPQFLGAAAVGGLRPDVAALKGDQFERAGFSLTTSSLAPGVYDILVYPYSHHTGRFEDAHSVRVFVR